MNHKCLPELAMGKKWNVQVLDELWRCGPCTECIDKSFVTFGEQLHAKNLRPSWAYCWWVSFSSLQKTWFLSSVLDLPFMKTWRTRSFVDFDQMWKRQRRSRWIVTNQTCLPLGWFRACALAWFVGRRRRPSSPESLNRQSHECVHATDCWPLRD